MKSRNEYAKELKKCERCSSCCLQVDWLEVVEDDIRRWIQEERTDILMYVEGWNEWCWENMLVRDRPEVIIDFLINGDILANEFPYDPEEKEQLDVCPFLRKAYGKRMFECMIHDTKPQTCKEYVCKLDDMKGIEKRSFEENYKIYKQRRRYSPSVLKYHRKQRGHT
jgi:Fe-S-cluster containining protein